MRIVILATDLEFGFAVETNAEFEPAGEVVEFGQRTTFKNASSLGFETFVDFVQGLLDDSK